MMARLPRSGTRDTASIFSRLSEHGGAAYRCRGDIQLTKSTSGSIFARSKDSGRRPKRISRAAGRRKREREREMASGSEREEQSAEEARENLERCFKSKEKGNGLIIMLSTALFN